jgi:hypothetical protein
VDRRDGSDGMNGCFYTCRVFKPKKDDPKMTRELALELYDRRIAQHEVKK